MRRVSSDPISVAITDLTQKSLLCGLCTNTGTFLGNPTRKPCWSILQDTKPHCYTLMVLMMCGDVEINPGLRRSRGAARANPTARPVPLRNIFPCGYCQEPVTCYPGILFEHIFGLFEANKQEKNSYQQKSKIFVTFQYQTKS